MATEQQKQAAIAHLKERIKQAEENGQHAAAQSWRDYLMNFAAIPARDLVIGRKNWTVEEKE